MICLHSLSQISTFEANKYCHFCDDKVCRATSSVRCILGLWNVFFIFALFWADSLDCGGRSVISKAIWLLLQQMRVFLDARYLLYQIHEAALGRQIVLVIRETIY